MNTELLVKMYYEGYNVSQLATIFDSTHYRIRKALIDSGVKYQGRKYFLHERCFEFIDSEENAYFLGLLIADGTVSSSSNRIKINLHEQDKDIVGSLRNFWYPNKDKPLTLVDTKHSKQYLLYADSKLMCLDAAQWGLVPRKSLVVEYPEQLPETLHRHFIRGYFDGDGSVHYTNRGKSITCNFVGTLALVSSIRDILCSELGIRKNKIVKTTGCYQAGWANKRDVLKIFDWMYSDVSVYGQRKFYKFYHYFTEIDKINS